MGRGKDALGSVGDCVTCVALAYTPCTISSYNAVILQYITTWR